MKLLFFLDQVFGQIGYNIGLETNNDVNFKLLRA